MATTFKSEVMELMGAYDKFDKLISTEEKFESLALENYKRDILRDYTPRQREDFILVYESNELLPLKRLLTLKRLLSFILYKYGDGLKESSFKRAHKNYVVVNGLLNSIEENTKPFMEGVDLILRRRSQYGYTKSHPRGRVFSSTTSIVHLSREFRYLLFKHLYVDIDIVNAHPTILRNYALKEKLPLKSLNALVTDRENFYNGVREDYKQSINEDFAGKVDVKKLTLAVINSSKQTYKSSNLTDLSSDMRLIRSSLKKDLYDKDEVFRSAVDHRLSGSDCEKTLLSKIQSLYCFDQETNTILGLKNFLETRAELNDSIVPFFDGLYVYNNSLRHDVTRSTYIQEYDIEALLNEFNETSPLKVAIKPINPDFKLLKAESFGLFEDLLSEANEISNEDLEKLIEEKDLIPVDIFASTLEKHLQNDTNKYQEISLSFECLTDIMEQTNLMYNKFIDCLFNEDVSLVTRESFK